MLAMLFYSDLARAPASKVVKGKQLGQGGQGVAYFATYDGVKLCAKFLLGQITSQVTCKGAPPVVLASFLAANVSSPQLFAFSGGDRAPQGGCAHEAADAPELPSPHR
jgi:hypothetical protein